MVKKYIEIPGAHPEEVIYVPIEKYYIKEKELIEKYGTNDRGIINLKLIGYFQEKYSLRLAKYFSKKLKNRK